MIPPKKNKKREMKRRVKWLSFFFCANFTINCLFCTFTLFGQQCSIRLNVTTVPARCQTDGEIHCTLSDTSGSQLSQIRYYYIPYSGEDSITESSRSFISHLRPGLYKVRVTALCATGLHQEDAFTIVSDSVENVEVGSQYVRPTNGVVYNIFSYSQPYGIVPSMLCAPTGKIQLKITDGTFPYTIDMWKVEGTDTLFARTVIFDTNQYQGTDTLHYDYQHYYTIDSLDVGDYVFLCHDGCGYYMPKLMASVPKIRHNTSNYRFLLRNSSGIDQSDNVITFKILFHDKNSEGHNDDYYYYMSAQQQHYEYRFVNPGVVTDWDTTRWYPMPLVRNEMAFIYDTVSQAVCYADIWFGNIQLQIRPAVCEDTVLSISYTIYPQGNVKYEYLRDRVVQSSKNRMEGCIYRRGFMKWSDYFMGLMGYATHLDYTMHEDSLNYEIPIAYTLSGGILNKEIGMLYHDYVTYPITYRIVNVTADTLIYYGSEGSYKEEYDWLFTHELDSTLAGDTLVLEITDKNGSPLYAARIPVIYEIESFYQDSSSTVFVWNNWSKEYDEFCEDGKYAIGVFQENGFEKEMIRSEGTTIYTYIGDTIRLIESPKGNFYNFTAVADTYEHFDVFRDNPDNHAEVFFDYNLNPNRVPGLLMADRGLPNGLYVWEISYPCNEIRPDTLVYNLYREFPVVEEMPAYQFNTQCTRLEIMPVAGKIRWKGKNLQTYYQVYQGDSLVHTISAVNQGQPLYVGVAGDYKLSMYALPTDNGYVLSKNPCFHVDTVIHWDGSTLVFDYFYSYVCNSDDTLGFVRAKAKGGLQPYVYRVFSNKNGEGVLLGQNGTGVFDDLPLRFMQDVSVEMEDACHAHFLSDFVVSDLNSIRKCWVEDGLGIPVYDVGDTCHLHGLAWHDFTYHWRGPDHFEDTARNVDVLLTLDKAGTYYIEIEGSGCGMLHDSLEVQVVEPWLHEPCPDAEDFDGNVYPSVRIDRYCWTQRNLVSEHYADGRDIPDILAYASDVFPDTMANVDVFGYLYTWDSAMDTARLESLTAGGHHQGICPKGWYLPEREQYQSLGLHGASALRSPLYWINDGGGDNETGFSALPAGFYHGVHKQYENLLGETRFWSTFHSENSEKYSFYALTFSCNLLKEEDCEHNFGYSIRCILEE